MEAFDPHCFALLCSFLYLNELPQLRLVCRSFRDRLAEPKTISLLARQPRALVFPAQWETDVSRTSAARDANKENDGASAFSADNDDQAAQCGCLRMVPHTGEEAAGVTRRERWPPARSYSWKSGCVCSHDDQPMKRYRANFSVLKSLLAVPPTGIRELSLHWPEDLSRPLCETFIKILVVTAPTLEHLMSFGCSLAVWRRTWPFTVSFPNLKRLDVANNCGPTTVQRYQECLKWHLLARCSFPACVGFRWLDSFEWGDQDRTILWHEVVVHQLDCFFGLLSSMGNLRCLAFTADSQYTVTQVLLHLASRPSTVETLEIIPGLPNCEALDRDWLLPRRPSTAIPDGGLVTLRSISKVCFVLRECDLDYVLRSEAFGFVKRVCPNAEVSVDGTLCMDICTHPEESRSCQILNPAENARLCRSAANRSPALELIRDIVMQPGVTELSLKAEGGRVPRTISLHLSRQKCHAGGWNEPGLRGARTPLPPTLSVDLPAAVSKRWLCFPEHLDDVAETVSAVLLRLGGNRKDLELCLRRPSIAQKIVGLEVCLRDGALMFDVKELLDVALRYGGSRARFFRVVDIWPARVRSAWPSSDGVFERFLDFVVHFCCPSIEIIEYRVVGPASWQRESGSGCCGPSSLTDVLNDFTFQQRLDCLFDRGTDQTQAQRTFGHLTIFVYHRRSR